LLYNCRMDYRLYDPKKDKDAVYRIWLETGWIKKDQTEPLDLLLKIERALVADLHGEPECLVLTSPGDLRYQDETLPYGVVAAVTTSQVARHQGLARRLTAQAVALDAADGAAVAGLGMFEQGFYNQLGFGSSAYDYRLNCDPARLKVQIKPRMPHRLNEADGARVHANRLQRRRVHGSVSILDEIYTHADISFSEKWFARGFGLGYQDDISGELTHHFWASMEEAEHGPMRIWWMCYQTPEQLQELLALVKAQSDQVNWVSIPEPPGVQAQDLIEQPFHQRRVSESSKFPAGIQAVAFNQVRIIDLEACLARTHLTAGEVRFNLELQDPIMRFLDDSAPWRGIGGSYVVTLGSESGSEQGHDNNLPTLKASVGAFTRLWLGVRPAYGLAVSDDLAGPPELLEQLDAVVRLPAPVIDWGF
jgi:hypothetical protein